MNIEKFKLLLKDQHQKYENYVPASFFILGFLFDIFTLGEIDSFSNILTLGCYLLLCMGILLLDFKNISVDTISNLKLQTLWKYREDIFHFSLGALLSAFTLFYFKSSSFANSFLFLFVMIGLLLLNEIPTFKKLGVTIRTALTMLCLISYLICVIPVLLGTTGHFIFYACLTLALIISIIAFKYLLGIAGVKEQLLKEFLIPQISVIVVFALLYIMKVLPPIPLSIQYIGIYHNIVKVDGSYETYEHKPRWKFWHNGDQDFKASPGDNIFVFTKIFAPGGYTGKIFLHWLKETNTGLQTSDRIPLNISGGRREGFRGFTFKSNYTEGEWQVRVETEEGLEVGRISFEVTKVTSKPNQEPIKQVQ